MIFCLGEGRWERSGDGYQKSLRAWNKEISKERYEELLKEVKTILGDFRPDARLDWTEAWKKVSATQWAQLARIPEFDLEITKKITGLSNIEIAEEKTINIEGKEFAVSELKAMIDKSK